MNLSFFNCKMGTKKNSLLFRSVVKIQDIFNLTHWEPTTCQELCQVIYKVLDLTFQ